MKNLSHKALTLDPSPNGEGGVPPSRLGEGLGMRDVGEGSRARVKTLSSRKNFFTNLKKNKPAYFSLYILLFLIIIAILSPILATDQPLYAKYKGNILFPAFSFQNKYEIKNPATSEIEYIQPDIADWKHMDLESVIWAPIPWSAGKSDWANQGFVGPFDAQHFINTDPQKTRLPNRFRHWLGTNNSGEDVLAGIIHGTGISLTVGLISMSIAGIIGILLGAIAGYYGDNGLFTTRGRFWTIILGILLAFYYAVLLRKFVLEDALATSGFRFMLESFFSLIIFTVIIYIFSIVGKYVGKIRLLSKKVNIPADSIISRMIEILISLPTLILIISIAAIANRSLVNVMIIIGLTSWTLIARLTRAEMMRIRDLEYIQVAHAMGFSSARIMLKHALPNGIAPALVAIAFGVAAAILVESALSFLGIGVPIQTVTWGKLLSQGKDQFSAWWLVVFPGLAIFITVTVYNLLGDALRDALDPRQRR